MVCSVFHRGRVYSILILLDELGLLKKYNFEVLGNDINSSSIDVAIKGVYKKTSFRGLQSNIISKYFDEKKSLYYIKEDLKKRARFYNINIFDPVVQYRIGEVDFIFCRNVLIYFDIDGKKRVSEIFYKMLNNNGMLFLGHSETLSRINDSFLLANFKGGSFYTR